MRSGLSLPLIASMTVTTPANMTLPCILFILESMTRLIIVGKFASTKRNYFILVFSTWHLLITLTMQKKFPTIQARFGQTRMKNHVYDMVEAVYHPGMNKYVESKQKYYMRNMIVIALKTMLLSSNLIGLLNSLRIKLCQSNSPVRSRDKIKGEKDEEKKTRDKKPRQGQTWIFENLLV